LFGTALACSQKIPILKDPALKPELVQSGLTFPTSFTFLNNNDILVLEKETGAVRRIINGQMLQQPSADFNVATKGERGLLGIATSKTGNQTYVFIHLTEINSNDGADVDEGVSPLGNRLYRFELLGNKLVNPRLMLDLPVVPGFFHVGGAIMIGPDHNLYLTIGDVDHRTEAQNVEGGGAADGTGGILRITQDGQPVPSANNNSYIMGDGYPLNLYYAYGIRNSFGIDFDPLSGKLWDTENGPNFGDEVNLVEPGFNSGFIKIQGIWKPVGEAKGSAILGKPHGLIELGTGMYSGPELTWEYTIGPSALKFFNSSSLGPEYANDLFIGNANGFPIYHFDLNENRTSLDLKYGPFDRIIRAPDDLESYVFGEGFGRITDIEQSPDGILYILCHRWHEDPTQRIGSLYRIIKDDDITHEMGTNDWINEDIDMLSTALTVSVDQGNSRKWTVMSSNFFPIINNSLYNYSLGISANGVNQLHSKVYYYDSNMTEIKWDFLFHGKDGNFDGMFSNILKSPPNSSYVKIQLWSLPNPEKMGIYTIEKTKIESIS
jgi:glucose/arabinose dehydrogenase